MEILPPSDRPLRFEYIKLPNSLPITHAHKNKFNVFKFIKRTYLFTLTHHINHISTHQTLVLTFLASIAALNKVQRVLSPSQNYTI